MSSSEQLTLGAKLCAILIRQSRSPVMSLSLSLFLLSLAGAVGRLHRSSDSATRFRHSSSLCSLFPSTAVSFLLLSHSVSLLFSLSFPLSVFLSRYLLLAHEDTRAEKGRSTEDAARGTLVARALRGHAERRRGAPTSAAHSSRGEVLLAEPTTRRASAYRTAASAATIYRAETHAEQ